MQFRFYFFLTVFIQTFEESFNAMKAGTDSEDICRVAFKAPKFWEADAELWFAQVEAQFVVSGITTDQTKFNAVIAALEPRILKCVRDIIIKPPSEDAYGELKSRVLAYFEQSESSRLKLLLNDLVLGDQRPSQLLCEMESLNDDKMNSSAIRTLWLQRLPHNVQQILGVCSGDDTDNKKLAKIADKIFETSSNVIAASDVRIDNSSFEALRSEIADLKLKVEEISREPMVHNARKRSRSFQKNGVRAKSPAKTKLYCWYHFKFKNDARKCIPPCKWSENS